MLDRVENIIIGFWNGLVVKYWGIKLRVRKKGSRKGDLGEVDRIDKIF